VRNARQVAEDGADVIVAQGYEAGGHTGKVGTLVLVPQVVDAVSPTPVVAAGGIGDGRGLAAALVLGAQGVLCGTVFLATYEAMIPEFIKQRIIKYNEEDTRISRIYTGKTARVMKNKLVEIWERSGTPTLPMPIQSMINNKLLRGLKKSNNLEYLTSFAGQVIGMIKELKKADDIVFGMVNEAVGLIKEKLPEMVVS
jgi:NAD(P)H-dependent flavin oxidoreductase YrpB (nitropropane dioxygenase family)